MKALKAMKAMMKAMMSDNEDRRHVPSKRELRIGNFFILSMEINQEAT